MVMRAYPPSRTRRSTSNGRAITARSSARSGDTRTDSSRQLSALAASVSRASRPVSIRQERTTVAPITRALVCSRASATALLTSAAHVRRSVAVRAQSVRPRGAEAPERCEMRVAKIGMTRLQQVSGHAVRLPKHRNSSTIPSLPQRPTGPEAGRARAESRETRGVETSESSPTPAFTPKRHEPPGASVQRLARMCEALLWSSTGPSPPSSSSFPGVRLRKRSVSSARLRREAR